MPTTETAAGPKTYAGVAWEIAEAAHPSLDADREEAQAAGFRRIGGLLGCGRRSAFWSLFEPPLPGEYQAPSLACFGALCGVFACPSFGALHDAVQAKRVAETVALWRGYGLPDAVIRLRLDPTDGPFPDAPPPARLEALREGCLVEASALLRDARAESPGLPDAAEVVRRFLSAW